MKHEAGATPIWVNLPGGAARGGSAGGDTGAGRDNAGGVTGDVDGGAARGGNIGGDIGAGGDNVGGVTGEVDGGATIGDGARPGSVEPVPGCGVPVGAPPVVVVTFAGVGRLPPSNDVVLWQPLQSTPA